MGTQNTDPIEDIMTTMDRLQQELDNLDKARDELTTNPKGYSTQTVSSARIYSTQPKKYAPVTAPKPVRPKPAGNGSALPPPGPHSKAPPPATMPKPNRATIKVPPAPPPKTSPRHQQFSTAALPTQEDFLPPPPPASKPAYSSPGDDFLPPPPPELMGGGGTQQDTPLPPPPPPAAPVTMQTYNEPRPPPQPQPSYNKPAYQRVPPQQQNVPPEPPKSYAGQSAVPKPTDQPITAPAQKGTEAEIDALTNLLMQNMEVAPDEGEFFGICAKCGQKVVGDNNGCTAMDQVYHIDCFTCDTCHTKLRGFPFYALEGKAFCETCYMDSLEKCSTCSKPITERILRATGKPYHPHCFTCVVCGKSLDGIPFTVDATNQIHCIEDFHKKFAPRCSVCLQPIMPEPGQEETVRIVALDRSFHVNCYRCEDCNVLLSSEADGRGCFPLDDHILCRDCNTKRVQALTAP
ncbi:lipoma-preferred partner homolog isoform X2 [Acanthaster planci]|uniref:Lipoma-preferred partner homolog isoform X2 n=1 Tax=Acanthaster planci TaxID=133434 RepID=A0A8B7YCL2_ACAPL|nr:lipoma-preferred partner homolog isoform X2 [Acanthaster planci]